MVPLAGSPAPGSESTPQGTSAVGRNRTRSAVHCTTRVAGEQTDGRHIQCVPAAGKVEGADQGDQGAQGAVKELIEIEAAVAAPELGAH